MTAPRSSSRDGNFHGRTTTIIGFSSEPDYKDGFGPFAPGFRSRSVRRSRRDGTRRSRKNTAAILIEPIQGEGGIIVPPAGYIAGVRALCDAHDVILILDEVQSGLGRAGDWFAFQHEGVMPDGVILGKALGGGVLPVSAFVGKAELMDVFTPGSHGSTFGGNPLAAAVGLEALKVMDDEMLVERSRDLGAHMLRRLRAIKNPVLKDVRGRGLWAGAEIDPRFASARDVCDRLLAKGVLSKDTHGTVVRLAPPLVIARADLDIALDLFEETLNDVTRKAQKCGCRRWHSQLKDGDMTETSRPRILMCRPDHFGVFYEINPWMHPQDWQHDERTLADQSHREWDGLRETSSFLGATDRLRAGGGRRSGSRLHGQCRRSCSTARRCWRAFAIRSAARRRAITRRRSAPCRRRA